MHAKQGGELKRWGIFILITALLGALIWCGLTLYRHLRGNESGGSGQPVTIGLTDPPRSLDIRTETGTTVERAWLGNVYETLIGIDEHNQLVPSLASAWSTSDDGLTMTLSIRQGVRFSNGDELDATDAVWSLQHIITNKYQGVDQLGNLASVSNPDAHTVIIRLRSPDPALPRSLAGRAGIVYDGEARIDYATTAVGSGPLRIDRIFTSDNDDSPTAQGSAIESITLKRRNDYWGAQAASSAITLRYYDDDSSLAEALDAGHDMDVAYPSQASTAQRYADDKRFSLSSAASSTMMVLAFNNDADSPFSDERIRKALRHMIDKDALMASQPDADQKLGGPIPPLEPGYEDLTGLFPYDAAQGRSMLSIFPARYIGTLRLIAEPDARSVAQTIASQLQASGVDVDVEIISDHNVYLDHLQAKNYAMALLAVDAESSMGAFASAQAPYYFENAEVQQAWSQAMGAANDDDYVNGLRRYARAVSQNAASEWLYTIKTYAIAGQTVTGLPTIMTGSRLDASRIAK